MEHPPSSRRPPDDPSGGNRSHQTQIGGTDGAGKKLCPSCEARYPEHFQACPRDGTALVEVDETVGTILSGTYFVRRVLGEGSMGKVFEARHTRLPAKRFAIKMLHPEYVREPQILGRFAREAEAAATIDHPNVAAVIDVDRTPDGRPFLVSEFLQGKDFGDYLLETGKIPVASAVRVTVQIAEALTSAHARGIIHRDLKPENVFLTGDLAAPVAKVLDFGMARLERGEGKALTNAGAVLGTPSFMPPEQARGEPVDYRADIYAIGAILYTALTGQRPFDRPTLPETLVAVLTEEPPPPRSIEPTIPPGLEVVVLRAMAREPSERYASMEALAQALAPWDVGARIKPVSTPPPRTMPPARDDQLVANAHRALIGLLAVGLGWAAATLSATISVLVRATRGADEGLSGGETAMVLAVVVAGLAPPFYLAWHAIHRGPWKSPIQAAAVVRRAAPPVFGVLMVYGASCAAVHALAALFGHGARDAWLGWDVALMLVGLLGAGVPKLLSWVSSRP
jgi:serine/threonine-protein kinase